MQTAPLSTSPSPVQDPARCRCERICPSGILHRPPALFTLTIIAVAKTAAVFDSRRLAIRIVVHPDALPALCSTVTS
jgi:hypothetical protein